MTRRTMHTPGPPRHRSGESYTSQRVPPIGVPHVCKVSPFLDCRSSSVVCHPFRCLRLHRVHAVWGVVGCDGWRVGAGVPVARSVNGWSVVIGRRVLLESGRVLSARTYVLYRYRLARRSGFSPAGARDIARYCCQSLGLELCRAPRMVAKFSRRSGMAVPS